MAYMNNRELLHLVLHGNDRDSTVAYATLLDRGFSESQVIDLLSKLDLANGLHRR